MSLVISRLTEEENVVRFLRHLSRRKKAVIICAFLVILILLSKIYLSTTYAFFSYDKTTTRSLSSTYSTPTFINIPTTKIALPIDETAVSHGFWDVNDESASYLSTSSVPGEKGNTVIYAKNTPDGFSKLTSLQKGDIIIVDTKDGLMHEYEVTITEIVSPTNSDLINTTDKEVLTLYTSYGFGDLKRFVVRALPVTN
jgi:LPXTG-site transpeptidase (sortase) family protein